MNNRFMVSVAALALIAGTGFANAQGTGTSREAPSAGYSSQQSAPSSDHSKMNRESEPGMKSTQSEQKSPAAGKSQRSEENMPGQKSKSMSSENERATGSKEMKAEGREQKNATEQQKSVTGQGNATEQQKNATEQRNATEQKGAASESRSQTTVGQAGAGAKLSEEQRTKITTVIRGEHVAPVNNVNFSIAVGTRVPREVSFHPLPREIVTIYPDWRGYEFFLVRDEIVVVNPRTLEIVAVLPA